MRPLIFVDEAAADGATLDAIAGQVSDMVIWPGRAELPTTG
jgi:hypothetical protein